MNNKITINTLLLLLPLFLLFSCNSATKPKSIPELFSRIDEVHGELLSADILFGNPYQIEKIDSFLLILDRYEGDFMTLLNLSTGETERKLKIGRGPNELLNIIISQVIDDTILNIHERNGRSIVQFKVSDILYDSIPPIMNKTALSFPVSNIQEAEDCYVGTGLLEHNMFAVLDKNGRKIHEYIPYPKVAEKFTNTPSRAIAYRSNIRVSSDRKKMVQAGSFYDLLGFYRIDRDSIIEYKKYFYNEANVAGTATGIDMLPESTRYFAMLYSTDDKVYALYRGYPYAKRDDPDNPYYILSFD